MKILLCHNRYLQRGGEDQVFDDERELLKSAGFEVVEYVTSSRVLENKGSLGVAKLTIWNSESYRQVRKLIRDTRPALMHCTNTFPVLSPSVFAAAKRENVPIVQSLHNFRSVCAGSLLLRDGSSCEKCLGKTIPLAGIVHRCYRDSLAASTVLSVVIGMENIKRKFTSHIDRYIALSQHAKQTLVRGGFSAEKIDVKPNFIANNPKFGLGQGGYYLFVGRLSEEKGLHTLLDSWSTLPSSFQLHIVGDGPLAPLIRSAVKTRPNVHWSGSLPSSQVMEELRDATALIVPSLCYEMCPKVILESYAVGTPVMASNHGALQEYVLPARTGELFAPGDASDLASKLLQFENGYANDFQFRKSIRSHFEENFTPEVNLQKLIATYRSVLKTRNLATDDLEALCKRNVLSFS